MALFGIDMDDTLFPFNEVLIPFYNKKYNDNLKYEDITDYEIRKFVKKECENYFKEFATEEIMLGLNPMPNSINVTQKLSKKNENFIVTAGHPNTSVVRNKLMAMHYPWYDEHRFWRVTEKGILKLDVLIDDHYRNFIGFDGVKILMNRPWNLKYKDQSLIRVNNWYELEDILSMYF